MVPNYGSPFAIESAHIQFKDTDVCAEVTRSLFETARQYRESFDVFGSKKSFEWTQIEGERHILHSGEVPERIDIPDYGSRLPREISAFTRGGVYDAGDNAHRSFVQGGGHGGSHPHLVHEFLSAIDEDRDPYPNARQAANITCAGILSHASAMSGGAKLYSAGFLHLEVAPPQKTPAGADRDAIVLKINLSEQYGSRDWSWNGRLRPKDRGTTGSDNLAVRKTDKRRIMQ